MMARMVSVLLALCLSLVVAEVGCGGPRTVADATSGPKLVPDGVLFRYQNAKASRVFLVGDFNRWSATSDPLKDPEGDGSWVLFYPLRPGVYQYKFIVDGRWIPDPANAHTAPDGFGGTNSVVRVPEITS